MLHVDWRRKHGFGASTAIEILAADRDEWKRRATQSQVTSLRILQEEIADRIRNLAATPAGTTKEGGEK